MKPRLLFYLDLDLDRPPRRLSGLYPRRSFLLYNFFRKSLLIGFRCIKLQKPPRVHSPIS